jgi:hypothetical protein
MELAAARARTSGGPVPLIGILAIACFIGCERAAGIAGILVLHTGLIHDNGIARGIECLAI